MTMQLSAELLARQVETKFSPHAHDSAHDDDWHVVLIDHGDAGIKGYLVGCDGTIHSAQG